MTDNPLHYEWTGSTAQEADTLLQAAQELISAHLKALAPGNGTTRFRLSQTAPVAIKVSIDLTQLAGNAAEVQNLNASLHHDD